MKKRFIAGAVCPSCAEMDRLVVYEDQGVTIRECVNCGFTDNQKNLEEPKELETRVNQTEAPETKALDDDVSPIRILH
ncbi:YheV family putative zinc ribbon protein [Parendozoicomonas haliclonae]|uniref:Uncharacterized protein n=1 Tax=Parendozoicomonas haliclonae TaxID=1960125 RepID=A0A1X7AK02_9GAMM|nr:YheV family putative zinc ribbon protein [Parendozoicomonas haliclonae]SMA46289.1 hypothetical protein EHSB41UT_02128 [Parendozoicomonas haliclonae]